MAGWAWAWRIRERLALDTRPSPMGHGRRPSRLGLRPSTPGWRGGRGPGEYVNTTCSRYQTIADGPREAYSGRLGLRPSPSGWRRGVRGWRLRRGLSIIKHQHRHPEETRCAASSLEGRTPFPSRRDRGAVAARVGGAEHAAVGAADDHAGMAHALGVALGEDPDGMAGALECADQVGVEALLHRQFAAVGPPGAAEAPARRVDGVARLHAEGGVAREDRSLELRLAVAAHAAIGDRAAVAETGERRIERVEGLAAGAQWIDRGGIEREGGAAVLPEDAGARQEDA